MATLQAGALKITLAQHLETMLKRGRGVNFFMASMMLTNTIVNLTERGAEVWRRADEGWGGRFITLAGNPDKYRFFSSSVEEKSEKTQLGKEEVARPPDWVGASKWNDSTRKICFAV